MKVLIDNHTPFFLAHGGAQVQIEQTKEGLEKAGVEVEYLRWWDDSQTADLIHVFGTASGSLVSLAKLKNIPVVMTNLFTATCNRSDAKLKAQGAVIRSVLSLPFGGGLKGRLGWDAFKKCAHNIVGLEAERKVLEIVFGVSPRNISVVPLGLQDAFLNAGAGDRSEPHLICVGTITERKNTVLLAQMAKAAQVPVLFVGNPYNHADSYWKEFEKLIDGRFVKYQPQQDVASLIKSYQKARGFILMSWYENWCLVAHEATACGLPLLLPDQKWSRERFGDEARYFAASDPVKNADILRKFYDDCPQLGAPKIHLHSWVEAGKKIRDVYESVLNNA